MRRETGCRIVRGRGRARPDNRAGRRRRSGRGRCAPRPRPASRRAPVRPTSRARSASARVARPMRVRARFPAMTQARCGTARAGERRATRAPDGAARRRRRCRRACRPLHKLTRLAHQAAIEAERFDAAGFQGGFDLRVERDRLGLVAAGPEDARGLRGGGDAQEASCRPRRRQCRAGSRGRKAPARGWRVTARGAISPRRRAGGRWRGARRGYKGKALACRRPPPTPDGRRAGSRRETRRCRSFRQLSSSKKRVRRAIDQLDCDEVVPRGGPVP